MVKESGYSSMVQRWQVKTTKNDPSYTPSSGDGRIVVGRTLTNSYERYTSIQIDELIYFNQGLTTEEIIQLHNDLWTITNFSKIHLMYKKVYWKLFSVLTNWIKVDCFPKIV